MSDDTRPGADPPDGGEQLRLSVPEMDCASCAGKVESALASVEGIVGVETKPTSGTVTVTTPCSTRLSVSVTGRPARAAGERSSARITAERTASSRNGRAAS